MRSNPYLQLVRPANLITSATDIIAGATIATLVSSYSGETEPSFFGFILLIFASVYLYAGGIAFNDVIDEKLDRVERPERPIPSGKISGFRAAVFAGLLLVFGIILASFHHISSGLLALAISILSLVYNKWSKHHAFVGPLNMGVLRGLNLLLGLSLIPGVLGNNFGIALIPVIYIFAITMVSRGEVHGSARRPLYVSFLLFMLADIGVITFGLKYDRLWLPLLFVVIHLAYILPPLWNAIKDPSPVHIRRTVMHGVLGIILLDAIWVSIAGYWPLAFVLLLLLPLSQKLGRYFSVT